jgi:hypothetical protein
MLFLSTICFSPRGGFPWKAPPPYHSRARVWRTFKDLQRTTDAYRTFCGTSAPHHTTAPAYGPPQASSSNTPHQSRYLRIQGSQLHTRFPPAGFNLLGSRASLQRPLPGLISERQNIKTACVWQTHHCVCWQGQACLHIQRGLRTHYLQTCNHPNASHSTFSNTSTFNNQEYTSGGGGDVGAFHGNLPHAANIDNQRNSTNLRVSIAMHSISIPTPMFNIATPTCNSAASPLLWYCHIKHVTYSQ